MLNKFWVVTSYKTDFSWIDNYTSNYIIYDKSAEHAETDRIKHQKNVGYNIYDICYFIISNYDRLPDVCVFIKSNVFKHCNEEKFKVLIQSNQFTPLESYEYLSVSAAHRKGDDGGYMEINNSWYIPAHVSSHGEEVNRYLQTYNQFLDKVFKDPVHPDWIRFAPGGNYIVPRDRILFYSKKFYERLMSYVDYHQIPSEAHIIERALYTIFTNKFQEKNQLTVTLDHVSSLFITPALKACKKVLPGKLIRLINNVRNGRFR